TVTLKQTIDAPAEYREQFLVDAGATDTMAPSDALDRAGIKPVGSPVYELANGEVQEYRFGLATIEFMGEITSGRVVFGPAGCEPLLGVTALESVGIDVDTVNKALKRLPAIPLK
ncbi:MAG: aspartyl protease family protein, partial [Fimbriimonadales bacterium]